MLTPAQRLQHVVSFTNNYIAETHGDANMFATVVVGLFNPTDGRLTYVNCGNEPPLVVEKSGALTALQPTGPVIGLMPEIQFSIQEILLETGSLFLAFTDGIPDALNSEGVSFGNERLHKLLSGADTTPARLVENMGEQLQRFTGAADPFDDITLLAVKRV
jgi:sigma-B regulation protein RsbU (phosphoserine phosphatase)